MALEDMPRPQINKNFQSDSTQTTTEDWGFDNVKPIPPTGDKTKSSPSANRLQGNFRIDGRAQVK
jgi:hypothetical protein